MGDIFPGHIARADDIQQIQTNIEEMSQSMWNAMHNHQAFMLGDREEDFILTPAPKRGGRYIDTMSISSNPANTLWLSPNKYGYKQPINKSKSSTYAIMVTLRNLYTKDIKFSFELQDEFGEKLEGTNEVSITVPKETDEQEFSIVFDAEHIPVMFGRDPSEIEGHNPEHVQPMDGSQHFYDEDDGRAFDDDPKFNSLGSPKIFFVIKPLGLSGTHVTDDMFGIKVDTTAAYGQYLQQVGIGSLDYLETDFSLLFKDVYAVAPTYICTGGEAIISGELVSCIDTHISIDGASNYGNVKSYIVMNKNGYLEAINTPTYTGEVDINTMNEITPDMYVIAIITTYMNDVKNPKIEQDDTNNITRMRSHHERLRRLEKEMAYQRDITMPPRLKFMLSGNDIRNNNPQAVTVKKYTVSEDTLTDVFAWTSQTDTIEPDTSFLTTDARGNWVLKSTKAETINIAATLKGSQSTENLSGEELGKVIVKSSNIKLDTTNGVAQLDQTTVKGKDTTKKVSATTKTEALKETKWNPWDDYKANRPSGKLSSSELIKHKFTVKKDGGSRSSTYPAMTFYASSSMYLKKLAVPIHSFVDCKAVKFAIFKRQKTNNKTNVVWPLEKKIWEGPSVSIKKHVTTKNGAQKVTTPFVIDFTETKGKKGLKLEKAQYIILCVPVPTKKEGSIVIQTYKPSTSKKSRDFLIKYHGNSNASSFRIVDRWFEVWYSSLAVEGTVIADKTEYDRTGVIESGQVVWDDSPNIDTVSYTANETAPDGTSFTVFADCGGGWVQLKEGEPTRITGGTSSFKWKAEFTSSNGKDTPKLSYNKSNKHAINFTIVKRAPNVGSTTFNESLINNCITSNTIYPGEVLSTYIGDLGVSADGIRNFNASSRFSNYEFLRLWASDSSVDKLIIDIAASDLRASTVTDISKSPYITVTGTDPFYANKPVSANVRTAESAMNSIAYPPGKNEVDIFTWYYADLTLDDFDVESVDYSNYDPDVEFDEHNLRMKIDTDQAYNDDNIVLYTNNDLIPVVDEETDDSTGEEITYSVQDLVSNTDTGSTTNTDSSSDGTDSSSDNSTATSTSTTSTSVVATKISSNYESEYNTYIWVLDNQDPVDLTRYSALKMDYTLIGPDPTATVSGLGFYISMATEFECPNDNDNIEVVPVSLPTTLDPNASQYELIDAWVGKIFKEETIVNGTSYYCNYQYVQNADGTYTKQQYHNLNSFTIFKLDDLKVTNDNQHGQIFIPIDTDNERFSYVKEMGLITLNGQGNPVTIKHNSTGTDITECQLVVHQITSVARGYNKIFDGRDGQNFIPCNKNDHRPDGKYWMNTVKDNISQNGMLRLNIYPANLDNSGEILCYYPNTSITKDFNHFAMQMVADERIPKGALRVNLCSDDKGEVPVYSLDVPTLDFKFFKENKDYRGVGVSQLTYDPDDNTNTYDNQESTTEQKSLASLITTNNEDNSNINNENDVINTFSNKLARANLAGSPLLNKQVGDYIDASQLSDEEKALVTIDSNGLIKGLKYPVAVIDNLQTRIITPYKKTDDYYPDTYIGMGLGATITYGNADRNAGVSDDNTAKLGSGNSKALDLTVGSKALMNSVDKFLSEMFKTDSANSDRVKGLFDLKMAFDLYKTYGLSMVGKSYDVSDIQLLVDNDNYLYPRQYVVARSNKPTTVKIKKTIKTSTTTKDAEEDVVEVSSKGKASEKEEVKYDAVRTKNGWKITETTTKTTVSYEKKERVLSKTTVVQSSSSSSGSGSSGSSSGSGSSGSSGSSSGSTSGTHTWTYYAACYEKWHGQAPSDPTAKAKYEKAKDAWIREAKAKQTDYGNPYA